MTPRPRKTNGPTSGRAIAYVRVSTDEQARNGLGLEAQDRACRQAAERLGIELAATFREEGLSGGLPIDKRPQLLAALSALRRGDSLIVAKRDRLGRDVLHVAMIESAVRRKHARIVSAAGEGTDSDDPTGQLMRRMVDAFSEYERLIIGARTAAALAAKRARGERYSHQAPYGQNDRERAILALMADCRDAGYTWAGMASELNRAGYQTRRGTAWTLHVARSAYQTHVRSYKLP